MFLFFLSFDLAGAQVTREEVAVAVTDLFKKTKSDKIRLVIDNRNDKIVAAYDGAGFIPYQFSLGEYQRQIIERNFPENRLFVEVEKIPAARPNATQYRLSIEGQKMLINNYRVVFNSFPEDLDPHTNPALRKPQQLAIALEDGTKLASDPKVMSEVRTAAAGIARETLKAREAMAKAPRQAGKTKQTLIHWLKVALSKKPPKIP